MFTVQDAVHNSGANRVELLPYGLVSRTGTPQVAGYYILFEGMIGYLDRSLRLVAKMRLAATRESKVIAGSAPFPTRVDPRSLPAVQKCARN